MYEQHFGFRERPFSLSPDPRFLLLTPRHQAAITMLEYGLASEAAISVLTGEIGSGKTTLTRYLVARMGPDVEVGVINHTHRGSGRLLHWAALSLGVESQRRGMTDLYRAFSTHIAGQRARSRRVLLIVDEAQNLGPARLEELRVLSNLNIPRLINQLCDRALVYAFADQGIRVDAGVMEQVVRDRVDGGIFPDAASLERRARRRAG